MAEAALVSLADQGLNLLTLLDAENFDCRALMWVYYADTEHWRLILATPLLEKSKTLQEVFLKIDSLLSKSKLTPLPDLSSISLVGTDEPIVKFISKMISVKGRSAVDLSSSTFNGIFVDRVIIHRTL